LGTRKPVVTFNHEQQEIPKSCDLTAGCRFAALLYRAPLFFQNLYDAPEFPFFHAAISQFWLAQNSLNVHKRRAFVSKHFEARWDKRFGSHCIGSENRGVNNKSAHARTASSGAAWSTATRQVLFTRGRLR